MAVYAIGDVHGCLKELKMLLSAISFNREHDQLWFVGDLINRGPDSLGTIRFVQSLMDRAVVVMGNHEARVIANLSGGADDQMFQRFMRTLNTAPDRNQVEHWLRRLPLFHWDQDLEIGMVHAGLSPTWSLEETQTIADQLTTLLRDPNKSREFFSGYPFTKEEERVESNDPIGRLRTAFSLMTQVRLCTPKGEPLWPEEQTETVGDTSQFHPWFELRSAQNSEKIVYGHWAAAGLTIRENTFGLDSGCVYGGALTATQLDHPDHPITQVPGSSYVERVNNPSPKTPPDS